MRFRFIGRWRLLRLSPATGSPSRSSSLTLYFANGKRECGLDSAEEHVAGLLIFPRIETEDSIASAIINGGVLEALGAGHVDFFDVHLDTESPGRSRLKSVSCRGRREGLRRSEG